MALLNLSVDFRYRRGAFRGAGDELTRLQSICGSHLSRCSEQESPVFRFSRFLIKLTLKDNRDKKIRICYSSVLILNERSNGIER